MRRSAFGLAAVLVAGSALAAPGTADVKYRGVVDLAPFTCTDTPRSSFIRGICYDRAQSYMLINLSGTWYHYCEIDAGTVDKLLTAKSAGRFFNTSIRSREGTFGPFDCRTKRVPRY
jgi:hypothetical protein